MTATPPFQLPQLSSRKTITTEDINLLIGRINRTFLDLYRGVLYSATGFEESVTSFIETGTLTTTNTVTIVTSTQGLTVSRLLSTDANLDLASVTDFTDWIAGTANQINIADDGDGTLTVATPQDIHSGASPTFVTLNLSATTNQLVLDSDGANTGTITMASLTASRVWTLQDGTGTLYQTGGTDVAVVDGGTGGSNAADARTNLGLAIGSDVQAWDTQLDDIAALAVTDSNFIVGDGANWVAETGNTARTSLGLGTSDSPTFAGLTLTGDITATTAGGLDINLGTSGGDDFTIDTTAFVVEGDNGNIGIGTAAQFGGGGGGNGLG